MQLQCTAHKNCKLVLQNRIRLGKYILPKWVYYVLSIEKVLKLLYSAAVKSEKLKTAIWEVALIVESDTKSQIFS